MCDYPPLTLFFSFLLPFQLDIIIAKLFNAIYRIGEVKIIT